MPFRCPLRGVANRPGADSISAPTRCLARTCAQQRLPTRVVSRPLGRRTVPPPVTKPLRRRVSENSREVKLPPLTASQPRILANVLFPDRCSPPALPVESPDVPPKGHTVKGRIVSLAPSVTSILCALGAKKALVGVTRWCRDVAPVRNLPTFGDCWKCDTAGVAALRPQLVIGSVPYNTQVVEDLLRRGLTFLATNPRTLKDIFSDILLLGRLVGREKQAHRLVRRLQSRIQRVAARTQRVRRRPRVYCESWPKPRMVSPGWVEEMVKLAGGRFVPAGGGRRVAEGEVRAARPDIVVLAWAACGMRLDARKVLRRPGWQQLPAIRNHQVYVVSDECLNTPGPPLAEGLERLAKIIHPEIFGPPASGKVARVTGD